MKNLLITSCLAALLLGPAYVYSQELVVEMFELTSEGSGQKVGKITVTDTEYGALFTPELNGLRPGLNGFHVHENPSCQPAEKDGKMVPGLGAGGHYDPGNTGVHLGPYGDGHLGDLPALYINEEGIAQHPVLAPRLKLADLAGRSLMVHAGGDNYSDHPKKLGGGGARIVCGVIQ